MSESCTGSCGSCEENCSSRQPSKEELLEPVNRYSKIKKVIGVVSGKGGVGKSFITSYLSVLMNRKGYETAILDADITGPSIARAFGVNKRVTSNEMGIFPGFTEKGTRVMSINLLLDSEETPVLWRGPIIAGTVKQFWTEVVWGNVDYMFVDMPPGTGDVPLTVFQSIPLDGIIIVTSPQELVSMIVSKAVNMAKAMDIPIIGLVENYSYVSCGTCGEKISVFGESHVEDIAGKYDLKVLGKLPIDPSIARAIDQGAVEGLEGTWLDETACYIEENYGVGETNKKDDSNSMINGTFGTNAKKIAVATQDGVTIFQHFGQCDKFLVFEMDGSNLKSKYTLEVQGSGHAQVSELLIDNHINALICGGIGSAALDLLLKAGIIVVPGQTNDVEVTVASFLDGSLMAGNGPTCSHHHDHGDHHSCSDSCGDCHC